MPSNKFEFLKDRKIIILSIIFIILSLLNIIYASVVKKGFIIDGASWYVVMLNHLGLNTNSSPIDTFNVITYIPRPRWFLIFTNELPMIIGAKVFNVNSKEIMSFLFNLPLFLFPLIVTIINFCLGFRSKRYDISALSLLLYCCFIIPVQVWPIVEAMLAVSVFYLLFHYLIADIDYKIFDIILITALCLLSYCSCEAIIYCGIILFITSIYYARTTKETKNKIIKYFIGFNCLLMSFAHLIFLLNIVQLNSTLTNSIRFFKEFFYYHDFSYWFKEPLIITIITILLFAYFLLRNKKINNRNIILLLIIYSFFLYKLVYDKYFLGFQEYLGYRVLLYIILPIIILIPVFTDIFSKSINTDKINAAIYNLCIIVLFTGCINYCIQIGNSYVYGNFTKRVLSIVKQKNTFVEPYKDFNQADYSLFRALWCGDHNISASIAFYDSHKIDNIIFYEVIEEEDLNNINKFLLYTRNNNIIFYNYGDISVKNRFWDLSKVYNKLEYSKEIREKYVTEPDSKILPLALRQNK